MTDDTNGIELESKLLNVERLIQELRPKYKAAFQEASGELEEGAHYAGRALEHLRSGDVSKAQYGYGCAWNCYVVAVRQWENMKALSRNLDKLTKEGEGPASTGSMGQNTVHISHHDLERCYIGMVTKDELVQFEEHVLICPTCQERVKRRRLI
jgi:hypothetical protein